MYNEHSRAKAGKQVSQLSSHRRQRRSCEELPRARAVGIYSLFDYKSFLGMILGDPFGAITTDGFIGATSALKWRPHRDAAPVRPIYEHVYAPLPFISFRSSSLSLSLSSPSFSLSLRRDPGGRKKCAGHVHSSHGEKYDVIISLRDRGARLLARSLACIHARASN